MAMSLSRAMEWLTTGRKLDYIGGSTLVGYAVFVMVYMSMKPELTQTLFELGYITDSTAMGIGIAFDVAIATVVVILRRSTGNLAVDLRNGMLWVFRVTFTHAAFTAAGVELTHRGAGLGWNWLNLLFAFGGFILIEVLLRNVDLEAMGLAEEEEADEQQNPWSWALVMAVSWDAPTTAMAKQWIVDDFNGMQLYASYLYMGLVVGAVALVCMLFALFLRKMLTTVTKRTVVGLAALLICFLVGEFVVLRFFGLMSLFEGVGIEAGKLALLGVSISITMVMLFTPSAWKRTWGAMIEEATESIESHG